MSMTIVALCSQIRTAFAGTSRPSRWPEAGYVGYLPGPKGQLAELPDEQVVAARSFSGLNWQDLSAERYVQLSKGYAEQFLSFHSHAAFGYYLPAYMLMVLSDVVARDRLLSALVHALSPIENAKQQELQKWQQERFSAFTADQSAAIAAFLGTAEEQWGVEVGMVIEDTGWNSFTAARRFWEQRTSELKGKSP